MSSLSPKQTLRLYWHRTRDPLRVYALVAPGQAFKLEAWGMTQWYVEMIRDRDPVMKDWPIEEIEPHDPRV